MNWSRWNVYYVKKDDHVFVLQDLIQIKEYTDDVCKKCGRIIIGNTFTRAAVEIDVSIANALKYNDLKYISERDLRVLKDLGIIIENEEEEIKYLNDLRNKYVHDKEIVNLTICPTLECNFICPYCYEGKKEGVMDNKTQKDLISFFKILISKGIKQINVTWYGGEPLLYPKIIEKVSEQMRMLADKYKCKVLFSIITNGYCISNEIIAVFKSIGLNKVQITLDGDPDTHNSRRKLIDGSPTFEIIKKNIVNLSNEGIDVKVRVNLDKTNKHQFNEVDNIFSNNPNVHVYPAIVTKENTQSSNIKNNCFNTSEIENVLLYGNNYIPNNYKDLGGCTIVCSAENIYSFVVTPNGDLFKCLNDIVDPNMSVGNLSDFNLKSIKILNNEYVKRNPFTEKECLDCSYMPICYGACYNEYRKNGKHMCVINRYFFDEISRNLF